MICVYSVLFYIFWKMKKIFVSFVVLLVSLSSLSFWINFSSELIQAYNWSFENKITTQDSIEKANVYWKLTRAELAKMISYFAINLLWKELDLNKECTFLDVSDELDYRYNSWLTYACQLWLMWQNIDKFRPTDGVTRAEFGTVLSRALRWDKNEWWKTYYENHLNALKSEWIMNNISSPLDSEIRWFVMLMLMRSVWWVAYDVVNNNQILNVLDMLD